MQLKDFAAYKKQLWQAGAVMTAVFVLCLLGVSPHMAMSVGVMSVPALPEGFWQKLLFLLLFSVLFCVPYVR